MTKWALKKTSEKWWVEEVLLIARLHFHVTDRYQLGTYEENVQRDQLINLIETYKLETETRILVESCSRMQRNRCRILVACAGYSFGQGHVTSYLPMTAHVISMKIMRSNSATLAHAAWWYWHTYMLFDWRERSWIHRPFRFISIHMLQRICIKQLWKKTGYKINGQNKY